MTWIILLSAIVIPLLMLGLVRAFAFCRRLFDALAVLSAYVFGIIAAIAVYEILRDDVVFMTRIHGVFNNIWFLASGAYLGNYGLYKLIQMMIRQWR
ncbi:hypothetical protein [Paenibacillus sp. GP183]|uniref:hypothetical protein n=1 Tax=Paenibacillus sp. GP183 TaxID=1882751 RepID=UPI00089ADE6F|nr:hypothetical protein [Paenibacillus sp. GP183]SEC68754.1 hypothetical protein SAMN05443246_4991 [Paenibacillus sp. GP183]